MRPLRLVIDGFGPFATTQVLDFRLLGSRTFFLIHGPTGAGKTSILDAMCYALYGEASGSERDARNVRSDLAAPETPTQVTFDFSLGPDDYRVTRRPEQQRPRERGTGLAKARPMATLWRRTGVKDDADDGHVLADKPSQVDAEVTRLLGFAADQFRQVIVLPQGQFLRLLLASSSERQAILQTLFATHRYRRLEEALKAEARALEDRVKDTRTRRQMLLETAGVTSAAELSTRLSEARTAHAGIAARLADADAVATLARQRAERGRTAEASIRERDSAARDHAKLESEQPRMERERARAQLARKAAECEHFDQQATSRREESDAAARQAQAATAARDAARTQREAAAAALEREQVRDPERSAARARVTELSAAAGKAASLAEARKALAATDQAYSRATAARDAAAAVLPALRDQVQARRVELDLMRLEAGRVPALEEAARAARLRTKHRGELTQAREKLDRALTERTRTAQVLAAKDRDRVAARAALSGIEARWLEAQAQLLAERLVDGDPCPVCGSPDHPAAATGAARGRDHGGAGPTARPEPVSGAGPTARPEPVSGAGPAVRPESVSDAVLKKHRAAVDAADRARDAAQAADAAASGLIEKLGAHAAASAELLGEAADVAAADLARQESDAERALALAHAAVTRTAELDAQAHALDAKLEPATRAAADAEAALTQALAARAAAAALAAEREALLPVGQRDPASLAVELNKARAAVTALDEALETARKADASAAEKLAAAEATAAGKRAAAESAHERATAAERAFAAELLKAEFADRAAWARARLPGPELMVLLGTVHKHDRDLTAGQDRLERACVGAVAAWEAFEPGAPMPLTFDVEPLERRREQAQAARDALLGEEREHRVKSEQLERFVAEATALEADGSALDARFQVVGHVARVATGSNEKGMTFERFVLSALLDGVLEAASHRLDLMSRGRFKLQRALQRTDNRTHGGLDLEIYDGHSGTVRPVSTLSGGESFLASLALALGLADAVQAHAGGNWLETLFIDEGFGSLDPEALDLALRALTDLQQGGRLVGVISHVPELRERIDVRLEVTPDRRGSRARFEVR